VIASRRFVFTRSPERPGISAGATTRQSSPGTWICRRSWYPVSPAASKQTYNLLCLRASFLIRRSTVAGRFSISPGSRSFQTQRATADRCLPTMQQTIVYGSMSDRSPGYDARGNAVDRDGNGNIAAVLVSG
jgi:hypothetical protein